MDFLGLISNHYKAFLTGAGMTATVSAVSIAAGMILGLWLRFGLISRNRLIRRAAIAYRSVWRGTPILVQLLIVFYLLPAIGLDVPSIAAAMLALAMNTAAFQAEHTDETTVADKRADPKPEVDDLRLGEVLAEFVEQGL